MRREYGDPGLMVTSILVNKWLEVQATKDNLHELLGRPLDLRFATVDTMMISRDRFYNVKDGQFDALNETIGFGKVRHFV